MEDMTTKDYWEEVKSVAVSVAEEVAEHGGEYSDLLWERVDGHRWVIYNAYHLDILEHCSNRDVYGEEFGFHVAVGEGLTEILARCAFFAFYSDVAEVDDVA